MTAPSGLRVSRVKFRDGSSVRKGWDQRWYARCPADCPVKGSLPSCERAIQELIYAGFGPKPQPRKDVPDGQ